MYSQNQMENFGQRFGALRKRMKQSQTEIAGRIDMDPSYLSRIERGKAHPTEETIVRIGKGMGFESNDFERELAAVVLPVEQRYVPIQPGDDLIELRGLLNMIELTKDRALGLRSLLRGWLENRPENEKEVTR